MVQQLRVQPWNFEVPDVNKLIAPIERGYQDYRKREREGVEDQRQNRLLDMQEQKFGLEKRRADSQDETERLTRFGKAATAIQDMQGPQRQQAWQQLMAGHQDLAPKLQQYGVRADDHVNGPSFIARSWGDYDPLAVQAKRAQIEQVRAATETQRAHAGYYQAGARNMDAKAGQGGTWILDQQRGVRVNNATGETVSYVNAGEAQQDPLKNYGLDNDWNLVPVGRGPQQEQRDQFDMSRAMPIGSVMQGGQPRTPEFGGQMRLGGPMDDIDRSMRPDEGRRAPQGVQVAQATPPNWRPTSSIPGAANIDPRVRSVLERSLALEKDLGPPPKPARGRSSNIWMLDDKGVPYVSGLDGIAGIINPRQEVESPQSPVEIARENSFGPAGLVATGINGIVTAKGKSDQLATREMQGQRAIETMSADPRARLDRLRQDQARWTAVWGRPPPSGQYYKSDGTTGSMSEPRPTEKSEQSMTAIANRNMAMIDQAHGTLKQSSWLSRAVSGPATEPGFYGALAAAPRALFNGGDTAQAYSDFKQIAMQPMYMLSGKSVAVAEMKNFIDAYSPVPNDSARQIELKVDRVKSFYKTLLEVRNKKGGEIDENDVRAAASNMAAQNVTGRQQADVGRGQSQRNNDAGDGFSWKPKGGQ